MAVFLEGAIEGRRKVRLEAIKMNIPWNDGSADVGFDR